MRTNKGPNKDQMRTDQMKTKIKIKWGFTAHCNKLWWKNRLGDLHLKFSNIMMKINEWEISEKHRVKSRRYPNTRNQLPLYVVLMPYIFMLTITKISQFSRNEKKNFNNNQQVDNQII